MAMKLLLNKRLVGLNESNVDGNLENMLHSQKIRTKRKSILKCDPNLPCHKNLLCTKGNHSGRCDVTRTNSAKLFQSKLLTNLIFGREGGFAQNHKTPKIISKKIKS